MYLEARNRDIFSETEVGDVAGWNHGCARDDNGEGPQML